MVMINGNNVKRIDIYKEVGSFHAYSWSYTVKNLSSTALSVKLVTVAGAALISGLENYALVPADLSTVPEQGIFFFFLGRFEIESKIGIWDYLHNWERSN